MPEANRLGVDLDSRSMTAINLIDVQIDDPRGGPPLVCGANLEVAPGEVVLIVGAAAAGTSRLVAAALGEIAVAEGRFEILGRDTSKLRRSSLRMMRRRIGIVPQELCLIEDRSAQLNVMLPLEIDGIPRSVSILRAELVLSQLGLASVASLPVDCLGAAARQRVAVARALVRNPDVVFADHPTSHQDLVGAELVCAAIANAAARGAACVVLGRDPELSALADRHSWRRYELVERSLRSLALEIEIEIEIADEFANSGSNLVPFPRSETHPIARTAAGVIG